MKRGSSILLIVAMLPLCWLSMMLVHELGHVGGAIFSGGTVTQVVWHPLVISRTDVSPNPSPLLVVWAGPLLGSLLPIVTWLVLIRWRYAFLLRWFAGFCLIANGAYIGYGSFEKIGDCRHMLSHGSPMWVLWLFGIIGFGAGLGCWNGLGPDFGYGKNPRPVSGTLAGVMTALSILVVVAGFVWGYRG